MSRVALIVTPKYLPFLGGQERECALLAAEFARRGFDPVIVTEQLGLATPRRESTDHGEVIRIPSSAERTPLVQLWVAAAIGWHVLRHRRAAFAIVRTLTVPGIVVGLLKALRLVRFPTLVTAEEEHDVHALGQRPLFRVTRHLIGAHDVVNGLGRANVEHLRRLGLPPDKITLIPNGIDVSAWERASPPARIERFLFLGRVEPRKGVFELLDAFARVHALHSATRLTIAGDGPSLAELRQRVNESGLADAVDLVGRIPYEQIGGLLTAIDCLVLPSYSEGMPLSVLEAAAHRRPMIITDVGDMRAMFDGTVRIVRPRDVDALAEAMEDAACDVAPAADYDAVIARVAVGAVVNEMLARLGTAGVRD